VDVEESHVGTQLRQAAGYLRTRRSYADDDEPLLLDERAGGHEEAPVLVDE
jgi:hypothetical protein